MNPQSENPIKIYDPKCLHLYKRSMEKFVKHVGGRIEKAYSLILNRLFRGQGDDIMIKGNLK